MLIPRILTALVLLPLMLAAVFLSDATEWAFFCGVIILLGQWEFSRMAGLKGLSQVGFLLASALLMLCLQLNASLLATMALPLLLWAMAFWLVLTPLWLAHRWAIQANKVRAIAVGFTIFLPAWVAFVTWRPMQGGQFAAQLLAVMGLVWVADIAAYFAGKAFGRHKLAPAISPGKSWEGVAGGVVAVGGYVVLVDHLGWLPLPLSLPAILLLAMGMTAVSVTGDLIESWFKRSAGIKDSSRLLPGHGGVYDRIDSLVAVLSVSAALKLLLL